MTHKTGMLRATVAVAALLFGHAAMADYVYNCTPYETRFRATDRLVSVEVTTSNDGAFKSMVYHAANGAYYDRGDQYNAEGHSRGQGHYWIGELRSNPNVRMIGRFVAGSSGPVYVERVYGKRYGQWRQTSMVVSLCDTPIAQNELQAQPPAQTQPSVPMPTPPPPAPPSNPEASSFWNDVAVKSAMTTYVKCLHDGVIALASISSEPAEVVIRATRGTCFTESGDVVKAVMKQGVTEELAQEVVTTIDRNLNDQMLGAILMARAASSARESPRDIP